MRVLIACEYTGTVRRAYRERGHDAWSCDLEPAEDGSRHHLRCDVRWVLENGWDLMIAHPPCTHLAISGARWFPEKRAEQQEALEFVLTLLNAPIHMIAVENPVGVLSSAVRPAEQIVQPWMFGDEAQKTTCLWLKNLPRLKPTRVVGSGEFVDVGGGKRQQLWYYRLKKRDRGRARSRTFPGMAAAMADQWSERHTTGFGMWVPTTLRRNYESPGQKP